MKLFFGLIIVLIGLTTAKKVKRKEPYQRHHPYHYEHPHKNSYVGFSDETGGGQYSYHPSSKSDFSGSTGLRFIAQGSADQANSAVANQNAAASQAAYLAKNTLAQSAVQSAATALAALKGKELLLKRLEEQNLEAHQSLESELTQLQQAKRSAKAAQHSAQQALNHVSVLTSALNNAQIASDHAQKSAEEAAAELASQTAMVGQAKLKLESLEDQLKAARHDYDATKISAEKASNSAQEAQHNANEAAIHATVGLHEVIISTSNSDSESKSSLDLEIPINHSRGDEVNIHNHNLYGY